MNSGVFNTLRTSGRLVKDVGESIYEVGDTAFSTFKSAKDTIVDPISDALDDIIDYQVGDLVPDLMDDAIDSAVTGSWQKKWNKIYNYNIEDLIEDAVGGAADPVGVRHGRRSRLSGYDPRYRYPQEIALTRKSEEALDRQNLFTFMDPISIGTGTNPYIKGANPLDWMKVGRIDSPMSHSDGPIYGPFSKFTPTALWPWQTKEGARMTAAELAEVPLEGDWLGTKPIAEAVLGQRLDKVGGIPGFRFYGDAVLGTPIILGGVLVVLAAPLWIPVVSAIGTSMVNTTLSMGRGIAKAIG